MTQEEKIAVLEAQVQVLSRALIHTMKNVSCCYGYAGIAHNEQVKIKLDLAAAGLPTK